MDDAFTKSPKEVLDSFQVDIDKGLTQERVEKLTERYGKNGMYLFNISDLFRIH